MVAELTAKVLPSIISIIELIGIFVVVWGSAIAFYHYVRNFFIPDEHEVKLELAESLATGLEFKMAAEILKTVLIHDLQEIAILGAIIVLRALLSFMIHWEMGLLRKQH